MLVLFACVGFSFGWDFSRILRQSDQLYGPASAQARQRIEDWQALLRQGQAQTEQATLERANLFFNKTLDFQDDRVIWRQTDYWATPVEALRKGAADCEDYAIAKYFTLRQLGIPSSKLQITYVKAIRLNQAHMVLTYYPTPGSVPLVLDNLTDDILPATERTDLVPVYSFNADGMWLPGAAGNRRVGDSKRLSRWQDLLTKMRAEGFVIED
ncbi:cysteine protease LapG [Pseudomonas sp. ABC1]|uniref:cysteine protease LapG n=1 Tax=Pseudomonas sp. ABC1 TaxID=2748080 RepID=UPI00358F7B63